jgi:hypothetical protein
MTDIAENQLKSEENSASHNGEQKKFATEEEATLADHEKNLELLIEEGEDSFTFYRGIMFGNGKDMVSLLKPVDICDVPNHIGITTLHNPKEPHPSASEKELHHGASEVACLNHFVGVYINRSNKKPVYMVWFNAYQNKEREASDAVLEKKIHATVEGKPEEAMEMLIDDLTEKVKSAKVYVSLDVLALELSLSPTVIKLASDFVQKEISEMTKFWAKSSVY